MHALMTQTMVFLSCLVLLVFNSFAQSLPNNDPIRINAGGPEGAFGGCYFQRGDNSAFGHNGNTYSISPGTGTMLNTSVPDIYLSESYHSQLTYSIPVIDDNCYAVHLHFAEIWFNTPGGVSGGIGSRVFDVVINGDTVLDEYDIILMEGAAMTAGVYSFKICLAPGESQIDFEFITNGACGSDAKVAAIEIVPNNVGPITPITPSFPVEWLALEAGFEGESAWIEWATASELNNDFFTVERSLDGRLFESIAHVAGAGFSDEVRTYSVEDLRPVRGKAYYRIRQTDYDGTESYSDILSLAYKGTAAVLDVFPNPITSRSLSTISISGYRSDSPIEVQLLDMRGTTVWAGTVRADDYGNASWAMQVGGVYSAGMYMLSAVAEGVQTTKRLWVR